MSVSVTYESDLGLAEKIIFNSAREVAGEEMKKAARLMRIRTPESVQVEFAMDEPLLCLPKDVPAIRSAIYRKIFEEFTRPENKNTVEIAYPHMELVLHNEVISERLKRFFED